MTSTGKYHTQAKQVKIKPKIDQGPEKCRSSTRIKPKGALDGKTTVTTVEMDGKNRKILVPDKNPIDLSGVFGKSQFERIKRQAHVVTLEDRIKIMEEAQKIKNQLATESQQRKEILINAQLNQKSIPGSKLDTAESEATKQHLLLLRRSYELVQEQNEKVKEANGIILATKCRAIRNAQLSEKELIEKEVQDEEKRLDMMMEQQRQKLIQMEEKKKEEDEKKKQRYIYEIKQQIKEIEIEKILEAQRKEEESKMVNQALIALQLEEEKKMLERHEMQKSMREEFKKFNVQSQQYKNRQQEEQRIADLRVKAFMKQKAEREDAIEREIAFNRAAKEKDVARLRAMQEQAQDNKAAINELKALRSQEQKEKEWRDQEKEAAKKRKDMNDDLKAARAKQIEDIRVAQAISLVRDEEDFHKVARVQREQHEKYIEEKTAKQQAAFKHRKDLLKQITEKERERIASEQQKYEEGRAQRLEIELKDRNVEDYLKLKIEKLREKNVPDNFIKDIERQLKLRK